MMDTKKNTILNHFGKTLVEEVFDQAFTRMGDILEGNVKALTLTHLHEHLIDKEISREEAMKKAIRESITSTLHSFLWMIDQSNDFDLVAYKDGKTISLKEISDGLCGELYTKDGWIERFSKYPSSVK